jgi:hypothetical protein
LKYLCQVRKVSRRILGSGDIDLASFLDFILRIWNRFVIVVLFALHLSMNVSYSCISIMVLYVICLSLYTCRYCEYVIIWKC